MTLPASIRELADVIGDEKALYLVGQLPQCYAGKEGKKSNRVILYVPTLDRLSLDHRLVRILGWNDARRLCAAFGGEILQPSNASAIYRGFRDAGIMRIVGEGTPVMMVAEWFGISDRHIRNLLREKPQEENRVALKDHSRVSLSGAADGRSKRSIKSRAQSGNAVGINRRHKLG